MSETLIWVRGGPPGDAPSTTVAPIIGGSGGGGGAGGGVADGSVGWSGGMFDISPSSRQAA